MLKQGGHLFRNLRSPINTLGWQALLRSTAVPCDETHSLRPNEIELSRDQRDQARLRLNGFKHVKAK
jgi:hypothetical protein